MTLSQAGTLILVVIGWAATHLLSEARERRKEVRARLDSVFGALQELHASAERFHCAEAFDRLQAQRLRTEIHSFQRKLERIAILNIDDLAPFILGVRRGITLRNFEPSNFVHQGPDSDILRDIVDATAELEDELERQYTRAYPPQFPYFRISRTVFLSSERRVRPK
ncbi:hypothetical protein [Ralstonia pseudosolanacearum]|uniref:hypothetical protein n=1 Tax=Ralstonia pseudosolanacearum TaxID=1310165 RepID=UPI00339B2F86